MTAVTLLVGTGGLLTLPAALHRLRRRLRPAEWARLNAFSVLFGVALLEAALLICAAPILWPSSGLHHFFRLGTAGGWASAAGAAGLPLIVMHGWWQSQASARRIGAGVVGAGAFDWDGYPVALVPSSEMLAFALPGRVPQIIASTRLAESLTTGQLHAVLRHEASHLRNRHSRYLALAAAIRPITRLVPGGRGSPAALELSIERWADEDASRSPQHRRDTRDALLALARVEVGFGVAAFSRTRGTLERLDALARPARRSGVVAQLATYGLILALLALGGGSLLVFLAT